MSKYYANVYVNLKITVPVDMTGIEDLNPARGWGKEAIKRALDATKDIRLGDYAEPKEAGAEWEEEDVVVVHNIWVSANE